MMRAFGLLLALIGALALVFFLATAAGAHGHVAMTECHEHAASHPGTGGDQHGPMSDVRCHPFGCHASQAPTGGAPIGVRAFVLQPPVAPTNDNPPAETVPGGIFEPPRA